MPSIQANIPSPLGGEYSSTGLSKDFRLGDLSPTKLIGKIKAWHADKTPARVVEKGGEYRLMRNNGAVTLRLDAIARHGVGGALTRAPAQAPSGSGAPGPSGSGASHGASGVTGSSGATGAHGASAPAQTPAEKVRAFREGLPELMRSVGAKAKQVTGLGQEADGAKLSQARGRAVAIQHGREQASLERELMGELGKLKEIRAAIAQLPEGERAAALADLKQAQDLLTTKLIGVRMPGVATMLEKIDAGDTRDDVRGRLTTATGKELEALRLRYADRTSLDPATGALRTDEATLLDDPVTWAQGLRAEIGKLLEHDLFKPELLHRLSDQPQMRDWSAVGARAGETDHARALKNLDAAVMLFDELKALTNGNAKTIDFLLGKDSRMDDYALQLKKTFGLKEREHVTRPGGEIVGRSQRLSDRAIETQHTLSRAWDTLRNALEPHKTELEKAFPLGMQTLFNPSGASEIRMDARLLVALSKAASELGKSAEYTLLAKQVDLLTAHMMLLEQDLDTELRPVRLDDLRQQVAATRPGVTASLQALEAQGPPAFREPGRAMDSADAELRFLDRPLQAGGPTIRAQLELLHKTASLIAEHERVQTLRTDREWEDHGDDPVADRRRDKDVAILSAHEGQLAKQIDANQKALAPFLDALSGPGARRDEVLEQLTPLAAAVTQNSQAERELAKAQADRQLGLGEADLRKVGFTEAEARQFTTNLAQGVDQEYRDVIRAISAQGLKSTADAGKVTESINKVMDRVLKGSMTQDALVSLGRSDPEGRANLVRDMFLQDITNRPGDFRIADDDAAAAVNAGMRAFYDDHADLDAVATALEGLDRTAGEHGQAAGRVVDATNRLTRLDTDRAEAQAKLTALGAELGFKNDPEKPKGLALSYDLLNAIHCERQLSQLEEELAEAQQSGPPQSVQALEDSVRTQTAVLNELLGRVKHLDPATMSQSVFSRGPATREALVAFATPKRLEAANAIITIRETPNLKKTAMREAEAAQRAADELLATRKAALGPSHSVLAGAIRAAVAEARQASGEPVAKFDPAEHRAAIEQRLQGWGIDTRRYTPEIDDVLHGTFDEATVEKWLEQSRASLSNREMREIDSPSAKGRLASLGRAIKGHFTGTRKIDLATRLAVVDTVKGLRVGERMSVSGGDGLKLSTGKIPIEASGTIKASATAFGRENKLLEVQRTPHGWELFFKAGSAGGFQLGVSADLMKLANAGVSGSWAHTRLTGAGLLFKSEDDLTAFLGKLMSGDPVGPRDWSRSHEATLVTDRAHKVSGGFDASISTKTVGSYLSSVGIDVNVGNYDTQFLGHGDFEAYVGASYTAEGGREWRDISGSNARGVVLESERSREAAVNLKLGAYFALPTPQDFAVDHLLEKTGALDAMDRGLRQVPSWGLPGSDAPPPSVGQEAHSDTWDEHVWNPAGSGTYNPMGVNFELYASKSTTVDRMAFRHDGFLDAGGTSFTRTTSVGAKATIATLGSLAQEIGKEEEAQGQRDDLLAALQADKPLAGSEVGFKAAVKALLATASKGDQLSVVYELRPEIHETINDHLQRQRDLLQQAESAERRGDGAAASRLKGAAKAEKEFTRNLLDRESSYAASQVRLIASSNVKEDLSVLGLTVLNWTRTAEGSIERDTLTIDIPGGAAEQAKKAGQGHGARGALQGSGGQPPQGASGGAPPPDAPIDVAGELTRIEHALAGAEQRGGDVSGMRRNLLDDLDRQGTALRDMADVPGERLRARAETLRQALHKGGATETIDQLVAHLGQERAHVSPDDLTSGWIAVQDARSFLAGLSDADPDKAELADRLQVATARLRAFDGGPHAWQHAMAPLGDGYGPSAEQLAGALEGGTPGRIADGNGFYAERQVGTACSLHTLNAALGGNGVSREAFTRFAQDFMPRWDAGWESHTEQERARLTDPTLNMDGEVMAAYLGQLHKQGLLQAPATFTVRPVGMADEWRSLLSGMTGDRAILGLHGEDGRHGHFVTFRRDEAGAWWLLDSRGVEWDEDYKGLEGTEGPRREQISPEAYVGRLTGRDHPKLGSIQLITFGAPGAPPPVVEDQPPPLSPRQSLQADLQSEAIVPLPADPPGAESGEEQPLPELVSAHDLINQQFPVRDERLPLGHAFV